MSQNEVGETTFRRYVGELCLILWIHLKTQAN